MTRSCEESPQPAAVQVSVMQGDIHCSADPTILMTILGSCVSVCLWDEKRQIGGMNHFVLPSDPRGERNARYGDVAIDELIARLLRLGCRVTDLQAKVFGGAAVLARGDGRSVGSSNVQLALERLRGEGIPVRVRRTGGQHGQQIKFHTGTGEVLFRSLPGAVRGDVRAGMPGAESAGKRPQDD